MTTATALTYTFHTDMGDYTVPATSPAPGLFVYEMPDEVEPGSSHRWSIGHHSGQLISSALREDDATRGAQAIAGLADWTKPADDLLAVLDQDQVCARLIGASCENPAYA